MSMSSTWHPEDYRDSFKDEIMKLVEQKAEKGEIQAVARPEEAEAHANGGANCRSYRAAPAQPEEAGKRKSREKASETKSAGKPAARRAHRRRACNAQ